MKNKQTIIVIGAGMAGLSAGIYAEQHGFHAIVLEKNPVVGGFCTGWYRQNKYLDGCIHWMTGTKENTVLCNMWKNLGAFENQDDIIYLDSFGTFEYEGTKVTFWTDLKKAEKEWIEISPKDKRMIHKFFKMVQDFVDVELPLELPMNMLPLKKLLKVGFTVLGVWPSYLVSMKLSCERFASKFRHPALRWALTHVQSGPNNLFSMLYSYATIVDGDGGIPKGGSKLVAEKMKTRLFELGGTLKLNANVSEIIVENKKAIGVKVNDQIIYGDYIVPCLDTKYVLNNLLNNKFSCPSFERRAKHIKKNPSPSGILISLEIEDLPNIPIPYCFSCEPFIAGKEKEDHIVLRSYSYDKETFVRGNKTIANVLIHQTSNTYGYWDKLVKNKEEYTKVKNNLANKVISRIYSQLPELKGKIIVLDIATPYTMKRYTNATNGAYMGYCFTHKNSMYVHNGKIKGINNIVLSGQWMQSPGGLPLAIAEGKFAIQRICKKENLSTLFDKPLIPAKK